MKSTIAIVAVLFTASATFAANEAATALATEAQATLKAGETKPALALMEKAIEADPNDATLQTDYAQMLVTRINEVNFMVKGMVAGKMLKAYERSVEIDPNHLTGWIGLSRYYLNAPAIAGGSADKAEPYAQEVHKRLAWLGNTELALVAEKRGDLAKAAALFQATIDERPDHGEAVAGLKRVTSAAAAK
ncbi:hypothetical protein [Synoicihabitans lomoniglobus]|uniref:Tetratricopeptide repeat protein n=1 Tax=Synoicihabitans lomoniglobus TaxID=2909285 RepID=A0AAE9ZWQ2_9BACT|nr:hypothetical protein [Opitutaceae bacterium LMO-M01]WED65671.1 hypothetical protein PXH66_02270 [Opitutaceae bacterium LMO-M01]